MRASDHARRRRPRARNRARCSKAPSAPCLPSPHLPCPSPGSPLHRLLPSSLCSSSSRRFQPPPTSSASLFSITTTIDLLRLNLPTTALASPSRPPLSPAPLLLPFSRRTPSPPSVLPLRSPRRTLSSPPFPLPLRLPPTPTSLLPLRPSFFLHKPRPRRLPPSTPPPSQLPLSHLLHRPPRPFFLCFTVAASPLPSSIVVLPFLLASSSSPSSASVAEHRHKPPLPASPPSPLLPLHVAVVASFLPNFTVISSPEFLIFGWVGDDLGKMGLGWAVGPVS